MSTDPGHAAKNYLEWKLVNIRYRRATSEDLRCLWRLAESDRPLLSDACWKRLPELLDDLRIRERTLICAFEEIESGHVIALGCTAFLQPDFLARAVESAAGILGAALEAESRGPYAFQNRTQVAQANRQQDLRILNFFGQPVNVDMRQPETLDLLSKMTEAWNFFHKGFGLKEIWRDSAHPDMINILTRVGLCPVQQRTLPNRQPAVLLRFGREMVNDRLSLWPASAMFAPLPRYDFTKGEQQLLEMTLLDFSDRDAALQLKLTPDAVKKRWRSIYSKVSQMDPALLPTQLKGADRRRVLLQSLRINLQELRPY